MGSRRVAQPSPGWRKRFYRSLHLNPRTSFLNSHRGGAMGSRVTRRLRSEKALVSAVKGLLKKYLSSQTLSDKQKPRRPRNKKQTPQKDSLFEALQKLIAREPTNLVPQLKSLIAAAEKGHLQEHVNAEDTTKGDPPRAEPKRRAGPATNGPNTSATSAKPQHRPSDTPARRPPGSRSNLGWSKPVTWASRKSTPLD